MKALRTASAVLGWVWLAGAPVSFLMALGYTEEKWIAVQVGLSGLQGAVLFAVAYAVFDIALNVRGGSTVSPAETAHDPQTEASGESTKG